MYRTTLVLLLLVVKLPMTAEERASVTVHQAEWGDTRGEAPPPSGPSVPFKANGPKPVFQDKGFHYGDNLQYANRIQYGQSMRYAPQTRVRGFRHQNTGIYRPSVNYRDTGKPMDGAYRPNIEYAPGIDNRSNSNYGFSR